MQIEKYKVIGGSIFVLGSLLFFSGCGEKTKENELNQEKVMNSQIPTIVPQTKTSPVVSPKAMIDESQTMVTPDPGNTSEGKTIKEMDTLLGTVSTEEYSADSLDENELLSE